MANKVEIVVVAKNDTGGFRGITDGIKDAVDRATKHGPAAGEDFALGFLNKFRTIVTPQGAAAIVGMVAAASPLIGATVAGAIMGGGAGLGLLGGLALIKDNPVVKQVGTSVGKEILAGLKVSASGFEEPVLRGLEIIRSAFVETKSEFSRIFAAAAQFVEPLANTISSVVHSLSSGFADMLEGSGPVFEEIMDGVAMLADTTGQFFSHLGEMGSQAGAALSLVFTLLNGVLMAVFGTVESLTRIFGVLGEAGAFGLETQVRLIAEEAAAAIETTGALQGFGSAIASVGEAAMGTKGHLAALNDELRAQYDPAFALIKAQNDLAKAQSEYNKAVETTGANSPKAREELLKVAQAGITVQGAVGAAAGTFNGEMTPALRATLAAAGVTDRQMDALAGAFRNAESAGDAFAKIYRAKVVTEYIGRPLSDFSGIGGSTFRGLAHGGISGAASGGMRSNLKMVGEFGPELVKLPPSTQVHSNADTRRMMSDGNGRGGEGVNITIGSDGTRLGDMMVELLRDTIRVRGGVVQTVLGKAGVA